MDFSNSKKNFRISWPDLILTDELWSLHCTYFDIWIHSDCRRGLIRICVMRYEQCCRFLEQGGGWGPSIYAFLQTSARLVKFMFYAYFCGTFFLFLLLPPYCFYCNDQSPERLVTTVTNMSYISFLFNIAVWECKVTGVKATSECLQKEPHRTTFYSVTVHYWHCSVRIDWGVLLFQFFARLCPLLHCISCSIMCSNKHTVKTAFCLL